MRRTRRYVWLCDYRFYIKAKLKLCSTQILN